MNRTFSPDLMERSYYLPHDQSYHESVQRAHAMRETCERIEQIDDIITENSSIDDSVFCKLCISDLHRKTNMKLNELKSDSIAYENALRSFKSSVNNPLGLNALKDEITMLENTLSALKAEESVALSTSTKVRADLNQTALDYDKVLTDIKGLDYQLDSMDVNMSNMLQLLDAASREVNHLRGANVGISLPSQAAHSPRNFIATDTHNSSNAILSTGVHNSTAPLFDTLVVDPTARIVTVNNCRISYRANSRANLNFTEINLGYVHFMVMVQCVRNLYGLSASPSGASSTSSQGGGAAAPSSSSNTTTSDHIDCSMFGNKAYIALFVKEFGPSSDSPGDDSTRRLCAILERGRQLAALQSDRQLRPVTRPPIADCLIKCRPFRSRVLILLTTTTLHHLAVHREQSPSPSSAIIVTAGSNPTTVSAFTKRKAREWLHLEGGVQSSRSGGGGSSSHRSFSTGGKLVPPLHSVGNRRPHSGSMGSDEGDLTPRLNWRTSGSFKDLDSSGSSSSTSNAAAPQSIASSLSTMLTHNLLPLLATGSANIGTAFMTGMGARGSPDSLSLSSSGFSAQQGGRLSVAALSAEEDDMQYRRAVLAMVSVATVTCLQVLLVRHRLVKGLQSNANSSLYNYSMLSSLVSSHFSGACRGVALALLLTIPVGFEAVMDEVASPPEDSESESDQEDEDGVMLVGRSSKQQRQYRRRHTRSNDFAARPTTVSGFTPLYDGFSRVSEMQQLLVDTATTLKHVCGLH